MTIGSTTDAPPAARDWIRAGAAVAAVGWGANQFAPLLLLYRAELGMSEVAVNAAFGLYALGLVPGLLLGGPLSDRVGRRRLLLPAVAVSLLGSLLLVAGGSWGEGWLFVGRFVAGVASGAAFSAGAAWITVLSGAGRGGPRRATIAMTAGFAGGPLVAGLVAHWAPVPTVSAYVPHLVLTAVALALAARAPETRRPGQARSLRVTGVGERRFRTVVLPLAPWVFASAAVALAYLPGLLAQRLGDAVLPFTAVFIAIGAVAGIAVQPLVRRVDDPDRPRRLIMGALGVVVAGLLVGALAAGLVSPAVAVVAMLLLGAGYGACQFCGLTLVTRLAPPEHLAGLTAVYQAVSYTGFALPFLLAAAAPLAPSWLLLLVVGALAVLTLAALTLSRSTAPTANSSEVTA